MTEKSTKYLSDILMAIELIEEFIVDDKDFTLYDQDRKTQSAVERQLAIIGEALNQFKKLEPEVKIENDKQIISFIIGLLFWGCPPAILFAIVSIIIYSI